MTKNNFGNDDHKDEDDSAGKQKKKKLIWKRIKVDGKSV